MSIISAVPADADPPNEPDSGARRACVVAVTSGKGGVGKTNVATNLAIALALDGHRSAIFDADTNLANINILLNLAPANTLEDLLAGGKNIDEVLITGPAGIGVVPAASGISDCITLDAERQARLIDALEVMEERYDYLLLDTGAGIGETVLSFVLSADVVVMVVSPEPTSLTDAFAMIKVLLRRGLARPVYILANMVSTEAEGKEVFNRFYGAVKKYLKFPVRYLGHVVMDSAVKSAVLARRPVLLSQPQSFSSMCFRHIAKALGETSVVTADVGRFSAYWKGLADIGTAQGMRSVSHELSPVTNVESTKIRFSEILMLLEGGNLGREDAQALLRPLIAAYEQRYGCFVESDTHIHLADSAALVEQYRAMAIRLQAQQVQLEDSLTLLRDALGILPASRESL